MMALSLGREEIVFYHIGLPKEQRVESALLL